MSSRKLVQLDITDLAFDGKAVAHLNGKVVFCNGGLPGETVLAEITRSRARYNQAVAHEIIKKADFRIDPICSHFDHCGGCTWQDLEYDQQLKYKQMQVKACLEHLSGLKDVDVADVIPSENRFHYRNKMEFSFHVTEDGGFTLGLHRRGRYDDIFDLEKCYLESELSNRIVAAVRSFVADEKISVYDVNNHTGFMRFLVIREGKRTDQVLVNLVTNYGDMPRPERLVAVLTENFPETTTIVHNQNGQKANVATGEVETVLYGPGFIEEEIGGRRFRILANSFFQTNPAQAELLYQTAFDLLDAEPSQSLLDLYCGTGTIAILGSERVARVVGVERVPDAVRIARENAALNSLDNVTFVQSDVKDFLTSGDLVERQFDNLVLDPPRAGLHPKALKCCLELRPGRIVYISCNPATFARDAKKIVEAGYHMSKVIPVDMFPHTKHIELVARFTADKSACTL